MQQIAVCLKVIPVRVLKMVVIFNCKNSLKKEEWMENVNDFGEVKKA